MRVWSRLESPNRQYFKDVTIHRPEMIEEYLRYLEGLKLKTGSGYSSINTVDNGFRRKKGKIQTLGFGQKDNEQQRDVVMGGRSQGDQFLEVVDGDGKVEKLPMRNIVVMANLQLYVQNKPFDPVTHLFINDKSLGTLKYQILQRCKSIPLWHLVSPPNIISMIRSRQQQCLAKHKKTEHRWFAISLNKKFYLQLVNDEVPYKYLSYETIKNNFYSNELKQLYKYFEQKIQQLLIDKELARVNLFVLAGDIVGERLGGEMMAKKMFPLVGKKYVYGLFNFLEQRKAKFWPYKQLSLQSIVLLYDIFLDRTQFKLSVYFDENTQTVQKIEVKPFVRLADNMVGKGFIDMILKQSRDNKDSQDKFSLKGSIFKILLNASSQMKGYYRLPQVKSMQRKQGIQDSRGVSLEDLIETMSLVGLRMSEISSLLRNFSLIMNVLLLEVEEIEQKMSHFSTYSFGLKENHAYKNLKSLYSGQLGLIESLLIGQGESTSTEETIRRAMARKQLLATILWEMAIHRFGNEINSKVQNISTDLTKTKRFQIYCHYNAWLNDRLDEELFMEEGSLQQVEYWQVGRRFLQMEFVIDSQINNSGKQRDTTSVHSRQSSPSREKKVQQVDSASAFRKHIQSSYLSSLERSFTSFNSSLIDNQRSSLLLYNEIKSLPELKKLSIQIFHLSQIQDTSEKYWTEFFQKVEQKQTIVENNYIVCGNYRNLVYQQKEGKELLEFSKKLLVQTLGGEGLVKGYIKDENQIQQKRQASYSSQLSKLSLLTPKGHHSTRKRPLYIETENLQPLRQAPPSFIKTPKRQNYSVELSHFVKKYFYGEEMKRMYRTFKQVSEEFNLKVKQFDFHKVSSLIGQLMIEMDSNVGDSNKNGKQQILFVDKLSQKDRQKLFSLERFNLFYDVYKQSYYVEASESLFFRVQEQSNVQKQAVDKIIRLCRAHRWRENNKLFMFRKKFLKRIMKACRMRKLAERMEEIVSNRIRLIEKSAFYRIRLRYCLQRMIKATEKVVVSTKDHFKDWSFHLIKRRSQLSKICAKIQGYCKRTKQNLVKQGFRSLVSGLYSLTLTTPSGTKTKMDTMEIDVKNVNDSAVVHSGNTSTSNVKNVLNKGDDKKSFMKKDQVGEVVDVGKLKDDENKSKDKTQNNVEVNNNNQTKVQNPQPPQKGQNTDKAATNGQSPVKSNPKQTKMSQIKEQNSELSKSKVSQLGNDVVSVLNSGLSGSNVTQKSQFIQKITKMQLYTIKDSPFFSFESWAKQTKTSFPQTDSNKPNPVLFSKYESEKTKASQEPILQVEEDMVLKQKIINASFVGYLRENINRTGEETVEEVFYCQKKQLEKPLLKHYQQEKYGFVFREMFNNVLKVSLFKNTSKKLYELLNLLLKPLREAYRWQKSSQQSVFEDEPLMTASYESAYNLYKDEMFCQLAKQLMGNKDEDSVNSVSFVLQIITKNYYPSPKLFYPFLNFIKTQQLSQPQLYSRVYENLIKFAQAMEGYKGLHMKIYKNQDMKITQLECNEYLEMRTSLVVDDECKFAASKVIVQLFNKERFQFIVRNETLRAVKRRMVRMLGFGQWEKNFGLYEQKGSGSYYLVSERQKAIDYLSINKDKSLMLRLRQYYPIKFTDINSLRIFYLNQISEEIRLPFRIEDYETIVTLGISFDEFEETRIGNYMLIGRKDKLGDEELRGIKKKLEEYALKEGDKRICEFQYFKALKEFNFLMAKSYKIPKQQQKLMEEIDRVVIKPKQLCFYSSTTMKSSLSLYRIKSFYFENEEIYLQVIYSDRDLGDGQERRFHGSVKSLVLRKFAKINELYEDIVYYTELLQLGKK